MALRTALFPIVRGLWRSRVVRGQEHLEGPAAFLYGNHSNNLDPFLVNWHLPWGKCSSGVLTAEYMQSGITARVFRGIGLMSTRKRVTEPHLVAGILRKIRSGRNVLIYPEGGRRWHGRPGRWMPSTAKLFSRANVAVHPVLTHGSYVAWPRWADWPRPARIQVEVLEAIDFSGSPDVEESIARLAAPIAIDENEPPEEVRPKWAFRPADGIERLLYRDPDTGENGGLYTIDGEYIQNRRRSLRWRMLPDSRIMDERTGDILLTGDLYETVRSMPLTAGADGYILHNRARALEGPEIGNLGPRGIATASLAPDHIRIVGPHWNTTIEIEQIDYEGVERNFKLQLTLRDRIFELRFVFGGSALQWEDAIYTLKQKA